MNCPNKNFGGGTVIFFECHFDFFLNKGKECYVTNQELNISGKLSDERFIKLSRDYELEQTNLTNLVEHLRQEVKEQEKQKVNVRQFIAAVRKYTDMQQLDASILREFVDKIYISEVYTPDDNEPRIKVREIEIVYNFIGAFDFEEAREQSQAAQKEKKTGVA